jgi:hypothetical protein
VAQQEDKVTPEDQPQDANSYQVGGQHYKTTYEHWDMVLNTGMRYLEGQATKYLSRWRKKNGMEDLRKALHYVNKLIEAYGTGRAKAPGPHPTYDKVLRDVESFGQANGLSPEEVALVRELALWQSGSTLRNVRDRLLALMDVAEPAPPPEPSSAVPVELTEENHHAERAGRRPPGGEEDQYEV